MLFSSAIFLFAFLPAVLTGYFLLRGRWRNGWLFLSSLIFFAWGGITYSFLLVGSIIMNYVVGRRIGKYHKHRLAHRWLVAGVILNLLLLAIFKYANFIIGNINGILESFHVPPIDNPSIVLPIGISFYTFQSLSYLVDVYRGETEAQKNPLQLGLYISLFPQLIAGPIVRYHDIASQLTSRKVSFEKFSYGVQRFLTGLAKKVLIANTFAVVADELFAMPPEDLTAPMAWLGLVSYTMQIYFDFSGYSDMAIGMGAMFGFRIPENFNFPYIARSIREFWRRWHISLSTWFRDYLYIPLGGNRGGASRTYVNLVIVFFLTGLWHGASWNFVLWGLVHGFFLVVERIGGGTWMAGRWKTVQHGYTLFIVLMAWVLFRAETFSHAWGYYEALLGMHGKGQGVYEFARFFTNEFTIIFIVAVFASTPVFKGFGNWIGAQLQKLPAHWFRIVYTIRTGTTVLFYWSLLILSAMYLLSDTYNPFIYYRF
jgi:alginate O-acetyltransferase complex protein AlgI